MEVVKRVLDGRALAGRVQSKALEFKFNLQNDIHTMSWTAGVAVFLLVLVISLKLSEPSAPSKGRGMAFTLSIPEPARPHWKGKRVDVMSIHDPEQPDVIRCLCPATGQLLGNVKAASAAEIDSKVKTAHAAWQGKKWRESSYEDRAAVLQTMVRYVSEHQEEVCQIACRDTGKTMLDASLGEVMVTLEKLAWIVKNGPAALKTSKRPSSASWLMAYKGAEVRYEPLGVVCAMVSWNYPLHNLLGPVAASLFAGDAVVVKCSEQVVWSSEVFVQIAKRALELHGYDPNLVQLISCWPEHADTLTTHPLVKHITFIGSKMVAHLVLKAASKALTPVVVELGGKDPLIVLEDYEPKLAEVCSTIMRGAFQSAGQNCIGVERVILHEKVHDKLVAMLEERVDRLRIGSSIDELSTVDMGSLSNVAHLDRLESLVEDAVKTGATLLCGGKRYTHPKYPLGIYFEPTMLINVTPAMRVAQEEVFGPILLVMRPAMSTDDCIELANSTSFGLGASVFSKSKMLLNYVASRLRCGNVALNDFATYHMVQLPFGGVDASGYGKFGGAEGLRGLCVEKSICYDKYPLISTVIPRALDYPIPSTRKAWGIVKSINEMGYATSLWARFRGIRRAIALFSQRDKQNINQLTQTRSASSQSTI